MEVTEVALTSLTFLIFLATIYMKMLRKLSAVFTGVVTSSAVLAGVTLIFLMLSVSIGVFMRYALHRPFVWVIEVTEITLTYLTFLATTYLLMKKWHVNIDIVTERLKPRVQTIVNALVSVVCAIMCLMLGYYGAKVTLMNWGLFDPVSVLQIPEGVALVIIPIGFFLLSIEFIRGTWVRPRGHKALPGESPDS